MEKYELFYTSKDNTILYEYFSTNLRFNAVEFGIPCDSVSILGSPSVLGLGVFLDV